MNDIEKIFQELEEDKNKLTIAGNKASVSLVFLKDSLVFLSDKPAFSSLYNESIEFFISLDEPFQFKQGDSGWLDLHAVAVNHDIPFELKSKGKVICVFFHYEAENGKKLVRNILKNESFCKISESSVSPYLERLREYYASPSKVYGLHSLLTKIVSEICMDHSEQRLVNPKLTLALDYIQTRVPLLRQLPEIAEHAHLPEGRMRLLFKKQLGLSIDKFVAWNAFASLVKEYITTGDMETASSRYGFNGSADFSHYFMKRYGFSIQRLIEHPGYKQVIIYYED
jgi:AraC-like DNA-binding protein